MKLLANPLVQRMAFVLLTAVFAFVSGRMIIRRMRRDLAQESVINDDPPSDDSLPLHTFHAVIQQLKQQKHELITLQQAERRRAKTSENLSAAVLSNLCCGVMFFNASGLVRQANSSARKILGFASPLGMNAVEIFRDATADRESGSASVAQAIQESLREKSLFRRFAVSYTTPSDDNRSLEITLTAVYSPGGEAMGTACLINDETEIADIRRQQELRGEMSGEMALELRKSLATISGYAQQLAANRDAELARRLAADIAAEAAHLDCTIGGFLAGARAKAAGV